MADDRRFSGWAAAAGTALIMFSVTLLCSVMAMPFVGGGDVSVTFLVSSVVGNVLWSLLVAAMEMAAACVGGGGVGLGWATVSYAFSDALIAANAGYFVCHGEAFGRGETTDTIAMFYFGNVFVFCCLGVFGSSMYCLSRCAGV